MPWVPESERDTAWYIFHREFQCKMSVIDGMTMADLEKFGMRSSGIQDLDHYTANEMVTRLLPIADMATFYQSGARILICNPVDTKEIYERISAHLSAWKTHIDNSPIIQGDPPLDDLLLLDEFAHSIYVHARWHLDTEWVRSGIVKAMTTTLGINRSASFLENRNEGGNKERFVIKDDGEIVPKRVNPEYQSLANVFKYALASNHTGGSYE
jgi:hypothetical protein